MNQRTIATFNDDSGNSYILCKKDYHKNYIVYSTVRGVDKIPKDVFAINDIDAVNQFESLIVAANVK
jgi:hypothetical protein